MPTSSLTRWRGRSCPPRGCRRWSRASGRQRRNRRQHKCGCPYAQRAPTKEILMTQQKAGIDTAKDTLRDIADATGEKFKETAASAQEAREYGAQAQDLAGDVTKFLEKSVKEKPMQTLAVIAALGFMIGA